MFLKWKIHLYLFSMMPGVFGLALTIGLTGCNPSVMPRGQLVDLTYSFDEQTLYWPHNQPFQWQKTSWGPNQNGDWYASANFSASEHGGTHLDAPIHFAQDGLSVDQIPLSNLMGEAIVLDIREKVASNPDYTLQLTDIVEWESQHGRIPSKSVVLLLTGWGRYWPHPTQYFGSPTPSDPLSLHFPSFSKVSAEFLVRERKIAGIGVDTASIDPGQSREFPVHQILAESNGIALENVANLDQLPLTGTWLIALPMKIKGGTGAPVRILGISP
ncbi:MAG: cyclase family protein [Nitrospirales bacterium]|nr:cyclase family protein [Nitrospirales bacterium]